jgi:uncharacterized protein (DUF58 family)
MINSIGLALRQSFNRWICRRLPPSDQVILNSKTLFIFPSKAGFGFIFLVILCWLVATNYENNLVFAVSCLLTSIFVVAILHSFSNLSGLTVTYLRSTPGFVGDSLMVDLSLSHQQPNHKPSRYRDSLSLSFEKEEVVTITMYKQESVYVQVPVAAQTRGRFNPGRLYIESLYPLGLLRVWTKVDLKIGCLVYPKPVFKAVDNARASGGGGGAQSLGDGSEDFEGLNHYRPGDSLKKIAWKQYAREQGLYAKHYADYQDERTWFDWDSLREWDRESRLSVLCGLVLQADIKNQHYGLKLPGIEIAPSSGESHKYRVLQELALFDIEGEQGAVT